jgi:hypothetical protein
METKVLERMDFHVQFSPKGHDKIQNYFGEHGLGHAHKL